jgi:myo-inositol-1(or 4)-monophosphatase
MNYQNICEQAIEVVKSTSQFIKSNLGRVELEQIEDKSTNSLVSYVDKTAEEMLVAGLSKILPQATYVTEEETVKSQRGEYYWIIDPLDGTTNFLHQLPHFSISVALAHREDIVVGIVHEVNKDECFYSWGGEKAFLNGKTIHTSKNQELINALIATGFPYTKLDHLDRHLEMIKFLKLNSRGLRRFGSAALDLAFVAAGRFDAYFEYGMNAWDVAAGAFLVQQAGGKVSDFEGGNNYLFGGEIVVGSDAIQPVILELIQKTLDI